MQQVKGSVLKSRLALAHEQTGDKEGALITYDAETFSAPDCLTVVARYRKALEMCGCTGMRVVEDECRAQGGEVCRYRVSRA